MSKCLFLLSLQGFLRVALVCAVGVGMLMGCSDESKAQIDGGNDGAVDLITSDGGDGGGEDAAVADSGVDAAVADSGVDAAGQPSMTLLGSLGGGESAAFGLNNERQVVGWALTASARHAFVWDPTSQTMTDLGVLSGDEASTARAINDDGLVVGTSEKNIVAGSGEWRGFSARLDATPLTLTALPDLGGKQSWPSAVNASGVIAGYALDPSGEVAVTWKDGVLTNIGKLSTANRTRAYGINDAGLVVGWQYNAASGQPNDAFSYDKGTWTIIGGQAGPAQNAEAYAVNSSGVVAGFTSFPSGHWHAARWEQGKAVDCGVLPGDAFAELYAINDQGLAVGRSYNADNTQSRAVLCKGTTLIDLDAQAPKQAGAVVWEARGINDHGDIVGTVKVDGKWQAFLLRGFMP